jgi:hypothetical protein
MYIKMMYNHGRLFALAQKVTHTMSNAQKPTFSVKVLGIDGYKTIKAVDYREAALKAVGKRTTIKCYGVWFDAGTGIAQITHRTKYGTVIVGAVAIYNEGV